ncbi:MAG: hypothetical protein HY296_08315 [Thaumarchaeota archaeon]|nr:hypothetical protein [Nitrososphaerota archaeon]
MEIWFTYRDALDQLKKMDGEVHLPADVVARARQRVDSLARALVAKGFDLDQIRVEPLPNNLAAERARP